MAEVNPTASVELAVIEFPGSRFNGEIVPELVNLVNRGIVTVLDLVFVNKGADGSITTVELASLDEEYAAPFRALEGEVNGLLSESDLETTAAAMTPGSSAGLIVWENTWARGLVNAIDRAGGRLLAHDRLDAETVREALAASGAQS
jgi:Family of unknown function (DUF6325)